MQMKPDSGCTVCVICSETDGRFQAICRCAAIPKGTSRAPRLCDEGAGAGRRTADGFINHRRAEADNECADQTALACLRVFERRGLKYQI